VPEKKSLKELAELTGGRLAGDKTVAITGIAPVEEAGPGEITFVSEARYFKLLKTTGASAVIIKEGTDLKGSGLAVVNALLVKNPLLAAASLLKLFRPRPAPPVGVHTSAMVHEGAAIGAGVSVGPYAVIEDGAEAGDGTIIYSHVYIGIGAKIGKGCIIYPGVKVMDGCLVGDRVIIHCNSVIGSDGFGYTEEGGSFFKIPQTGIVRIEDDVELGASVTVDRATMGETVIGRGTKVDNLVQVAHNVKIGPDSVIVAQVGIAGSAAIGSHVMIGGQAGINGHIEIGDGVRVGARAGVVQDTPPGGVWSGYPAIPHREWLRAQSLYGKLPELKRKVTELEERLKALEGKKGK
jgi:UDP-3-O-[3-hydroxymyristoyl] glucosamine N-acyltransferase